MKQPITLRIDPNGDLRCLVSDTTKGFLDGGAIIRRASHVEPKDWWLRWGFHALRAVFGEYGRVGEWTRKWAVAWRVNLSPVDGPVLPYIFRNRQAAIDAEVTWLTRHWL